LAGNLGLVGPSGHCVKAHPAKFGIGVNGGDDLTTKVMLRYEPFGWLSAVLSSLISFHCWYGISLEPGSYPKQVCERISMHKDMNYWDAI